MLPKLGMGELVIILLIVVVLFGANRLPQLGKGLGEGIRSFKKSFGGGDDDEKPTTGSAPRSGDQQGPKAS
jgi:sec-independent protein translocase protein TatA